MKLDELEVVFRQMEEESQQADQQYDVWRRSVGLKPETPAAIPAPSPQRTAPPPVRKADKPLAEEPALDRADLQVYGLRHKFCGQRIDPKKEQSVDVIQRWQERPPAEMSAGELHLLARQELVRGKLTEKARGALLLLNRQEKTEPLRRSFLYGYAVIQQAVSMQGLEELCRQLPKVPYDQGADRYAMYAVYCMAKYVSNVTEYTHSLAEQGYRDRQQALEQAEQQAQERLKQAQLDLNRM